MCTTPIMIQNPYKGYHGKYAYLHDTESQNIFVPCGHCKQCIAMKQVSLVQRVQMEAMNSYLYFSTLTYNNEHLPKITTSTGYEIAYADIHHLQNTIKRIRKYNGFGREFRYLAVSERGKEKNRPHFHVLWFLPKYEGERYIDGLSFEGKIFDTLLEQWSVNVGTNRKPCYEPLCTYREKFYRGKNYRNYDTHMVVPTYTTEGISSVAFYVCKYLMKANDKERRLQQALKLNLTEEEYEDTWKLIHSRSYRSEMFGYGKSQKDFYEIVEYMRKCVLKSNKTEGYPQYFSKDSQDTFPMAKYYRENPLIYDMEDHFQFTIDKPYYNDFKGTATEAKNAEKALERIRQQIESKDMSLEFNFLFD